MTDEFESKFPTLGVALALGLPLFYLVVLKDWWLAGGQLDPYASCTTDGPVTKCWTDQDIVSHLINQVYVAIVPAWNSFVADATVRVVLSGVVVVLYAALAAPVAKHLYTWWHTRG